VCYLFHNDATWAYQCRKNNTIWAPKLENSLLRLQKKVIFFELICWKGAKKMRHPISGSAFFNDSLHAAGRAVPSTAQLTEWLFIS
jgi:hypothetical protein